LSKELEILRRALLREKAARKQAEKILEVKSLEIYEVNQELKRINDTLEIDIQSKTKSAIELAQFPKENPSPVMRFGEKGEMKYANEAAHSLLAEIEKSHSSSVLAEILDIADSSIKTGKITTQEFKINKEYYKVTFAPIQSAGHVNLYYSNQTGYKLAEKKAIDNREKIETITRSLPDIVNNK
jgi:transcriptional regulator of aromatic amino acid metabolism